MSGALTERRLLGIASEALTAFRVVVVNGPRQSGKSTLLAMLHSQIGGTSLTLDDREFLRSARTDPTGFVTDRIHPLLIDEVQRGGDPLVIAIKADVDRHAQERGRFVLAGSSRFLTVPTITESLAGRVRILDLWPFSQGEIDGTNDDLLDRLFQPTDALRALRPNVFSRADIMERVTRGGFPTAVGIENRRLRRDFFVDYLRTLAQRDLVELRQPRSVVDVPRLLQATLARTAQELVPTNLANTFGLSHDTVRDYLGLFETIYTHFLLPAWSTNLSSRASRRPKLHAVDTGLAAAVVGIDAQSLTQPENSSAGPLLESFVAGELQRQVAWSETLARLYHYREHEGREIDIVVEAADGRIAAIEVKAAHDVDKHDFRHMAAIRDKLGDRFVNGIVLHLGVHPTSFGDRLTALPISALWSA